MVLGLEALTDMPLLNENLEALEKAIELLSAQLTQLHKDIEGLSGEVRGLMEEMGRK